MAIIMVMATVTPILIMLRMTNHQLKNFTKQKKMTIFAL